MRTLVLVMVLALPRLARADSSIGVDVVVSGDPAINAATQAAVTSWLAKRSFELAPLALSADGVTTLTNCLLVTELKCARAVVEKRASSAHVVAVLTMISGSGPHRTIQFSAFWISKARDVVSVQRTCEGCSDARLPPTIDALMSDLAQLAPATRGKVKIATDPPGVTVSIDDSAVGVTPVEHEVPSGPHDISLSRDGVVLGTRHVDVAPGATAALDLHVTSGVIVHHRSRVVPGAILAVGLAAIGGGIAMYELGGPSGKSYDYRDLRTPGIGVAAGGGALAVLGAVLLARGGTTTAARPTIALVPGGATVGWARSF